MKITKEWGLKIGVILLAMIWLSIVAASWADAAEAGSAHEGPSYDTTAYRGHREPAGEVDRAPASSQNSDDEYNFNWLDPEKKIYVLQNRRYLKANRVMLSGMVGPGFSNPYRTSYNFDPRVTYYFNESWGIEGFYTFTTNSENNTYEALKQAAPNTLPVVREVRSQYGAVVQWVPWYAKINVFNKILYFDWYFTGGAGNVHAALDQRAHANDAPTYVNQDLFSFYAGTGHLYHLSDNLLVRLDFTSAVYRAPVFGTTGDSSWYSNLNFGIGLGFRL
jgi:outer membrane beta-barrel protein